MLPDSPQCAALRADMDSSILIRINKLKAHGIMEGKSVIAQDRSRYLDQH